MERGLFVRVLVNPEQRQHWHCRQEFIYALTHKSTHHKNGSIKGWSNSFAEIWDETNKMMGWGKIWVTSWGVALGCWPGFQLSSLVSLQLEPRIIVECMDSHQKPRKSQKSESSCMFAYIDIHLQQRIFTFIRYARAHGLAHRTRGSFQS